MMPVGLHRLHIMVGGQHHPVPRRLQPQAQPAGPAEQVSGQMRTLAAQAGGVGQELLLAIARLRMRGQADERAPDELDTVVPARAW